MTDLERRAIEILTNLITSMLDRNHISVQFQEDGTNKVIIPVPMDAVGYFKHIPLYLRVEVEVETE